MRAHSEHKSNLRQCSARLGAGRPQSASKVTPVLTYSVQHSRSTTASASSATAEESQGNLQRWEESGKQGSSDSWSWTLNWNEINDKILVGSCPRSVPDVVTLKRVAEVDAILCLQSDGCFEALQIDYGELRDKGAQLGVVMSRVGIWDFNHNDQALMVPEAIRKLALLLAMGKRVYVHCTAGINRATLTVVGYLTFVKGWSLDDAVREVKSKRPQAHPYIDCWHTMRTRLTEGRTEEVLRTASRLYEQRKSSGQENSGDSVGDWVMAENTLIQELYQRQIQADLSMMLSLNDLEATRHDDSVCLSMQEYNNMQAEMGVLREKAEKDRASARAALANAAQVSDENRQLREAKPDAVAMLESTERKARLKAAEREINALKSAIREVAMTALHANNGSDDERANSSSDAEDTRRDALSDPNSNAAAAAATPEATVTDAHDSAAGAPAKERMMADRSSARAHNGARPIAAYGAQVEPKDANADVGFKVATKNRMWPLGVTWPFRNGSGNRGTPSSPPSTSDGASATEGDDKSES